MMKDVVFQKEAIESLIKKTILYKDENTPVELLLTAPVASGKTVISGKYMDSLVKELIKLDETVDFIWISTGKGKLHIQSRNSISSFTSEINVKSLEEVIEQGELEHKDALFLNWESVRNKDNVVRREENDNQIETCINNSKTDLRIVMIDEAHESRNTELAEEVLDLLKPDIIINITATPQNLTNFIEINTVKIDINDVVSEGFIKKEITINEGIEDTDKNTILDGAISKQKELKKEFETLDKPITPLCLIQIENEKLLTENGEKNNALEIKDMLLQKGIPEDKIAIWVSDRRISTNLDNLKESDVEYLIFKQAIATGWDCPRSHILVRFRDIKSVTFDIQIMGRILRTVEKEHYNNDLLDRAYIYTEYETIDFSVEVDNSFKKLIKNNLNSTKIKDRITWEKEVEIPMEKREIKTYKETNISELFTLLDTKLYPIITKYVIDNDKLKIAKISGSYESSEVLSQISTKNPVKLIEKESELVEMSDNQKVQSYLKIMKKLNYKYGVANLLTLIIKKHKEGITKTELQELIISNEEDLIFQVKNIIKTYEKDNIITDSKQIPYLLPETVVYSNTIEARHNYAYEEEPDLSVESTSSITENLFATYLNLNPNVSSWVKNGIGTNDFSITYLTTDEKGNHITKEYYPDFLVFTQDKKLLILDVKAKAGDNDYEGIREKYNAGKQYELKFKKELQEKGITDIKFSMVKDFQGLFKICNSARYEEDVTSESWETLVL